MLKPLMTAALLLAAVPAIAHDKPIHPTARVAVADLDLAKKQDRQTLDRRIRAAIDEVCRNADQQVRTGVIDPSQTCRSAALACARHQRDVLIAAVDARRQAGSELAMAK